MTLCHCIAALYVAKPVVERMKYASAPCRMHRSSATLRLYCPPAYTASLRLYIYRYFHTIRRRQCERRHGGGVSGIEKPGRRRRRRHQASAAKKYGGIAICCHLLQRVCWRGEAAARKIIMAKTSEISGVSAKIISISDEKSISKRKRKQHGGERQRLA